MRLKDAEVVEFLRGANSVRDGRLTDLSLREADWKYAVSLTFEVPLGTEGKVYRLDLGDAYQFDYQFSTDSTAQEIAFVKCLWTQGGFYLSLDPWKESERFVSDQDNNWFKSRSVILTVERGEAAGA